MTHALSDKRMSDHDLRATYRTFRTDYATAQSRYEKCVYFKLLATIVRIAKAPHVDFQQEAGA